MKDVQAGFAELSVEARRLVNVMVGVTVVALGIAVVALVVAAKK